MSIDNNATYIVDAYAPPRDHPEGYGKGNGISPHNAIVFSEQFSDCLVTMREQWIMPQKLILVLLTKTWKRCFWPT